MRVTSSSLPSTIPLRLLPDDFLSLSPDEQLLFVQQTRGLRAAARAKKKQTWTNRENTGGVKKAPILQEEFEIG